MVTIIEIIKIINNKGSSQPLEVEKGSKHCAKWGSGNPFCGPFQKYGFYKNYHNKNNKIINKKCHNKNNKRNNNKWGLGRAEKGLTIIWGGGLDVMAAYSTTSEKETGHSSEEGNCGSGDRNLGNCQV